MLAIHNGFVGCVSFFNLRGCPSGGIIMGGIRKTVARKTRPLVVDPKIQAERLRIAQHIVRALRATNAASAMTVLRGD